MLKVLESTSWCHLRLGEDWYLDTMNLLLDRLGLGDVGRVNVELMNR